MSGVLGGLIGSEVKTRVSGGNFVANDGTYYYRVFTASGNLTVQNGYLTTDVFLVSGGGAGGGATSASGGGGSGSVATQTGLQYGGFNSGGNVVVTIGGGGATPSTSTQGGSGTISSVASDIQTISAYGGGGGGGGIGSSSLSGISGLIGGSGGGGGTNAATGTSGKGGGSTRVPTGTSLTTYQNIGGTGFGGTATTARNSGGGGGSSVAGTSSSSTVVGNGGNGITTTDIASMLQLIAPNVSGWTTSNFQSTFNTSSGASIFPFSSVTGTAPIYNGMYVSAVSGGNQVFSAGTYIAAIDFFSSTFSINSASIFNMAANTTITATFGRHIAGGGAGARVANATTVTSWGTPGFGGCSSIGGSMNALNNTGAGGNGSNKLGTAAYGNGGSGIVIFKYLMNSVIS